MYYSRGALLWTNIAGNQDRLYSFNTPTISFTLLQSPIAEEPRVRGTDLRPGVRNTGSCTKMAMTGLCKSSHIKRIFISFRTDV